MTETQLAIQEIIEEIRQIVTVKRRVSETKLELGASEKLLKHMSKQLEKELMDVEQMESMSMKAVFYKVLGSKEEQIEKERQEYLQMSLKYNEQKDKVELLEFELGVLDKKVSNIGGLTKRLKALKKKREKEIIRTNPVQAQDLIYLSQQIDDNILHSRKLSEAFDAGNKCFKTLGVIIQELKNAQHWGKWDTYGGKRGRRSGYMKHGAIDRARNMANIANHEIHKFSKELKEAGVSVNRFDLSMDSFSGFMDVFFDNLITDWIMQKKIMNSLNNIIVTKDRVARIMDSVELKVSQLLEHNKQLEKEYDKVLIS